MPAILLVLALLLVPWPAATQEGAAPSPGVPAHFEAFGAEVDRFWLDGPLRISPEEQVEFLRRLARDDLPFSPGVMETVRGIMVETEGEGWTLLAKTGWGLSHAPGAGEDHTGDPGGSGRALTGCGRTVPAPGTEGETRRRDRWLPRPPLTTVRGLLRGRRRISPPLDRRSPKR